MEFFQPRRWDLSEIVGVVKKSHNLSEKSVFRRIYIPIYLASPVEHEF